MSKKKKKVPVTTNDFSGKPFSIRLDYDVIPLVVEIQKYRRSGFLSDWINSKLREELKNSKSLLERQRERALERRRRRIVDARIKNFRWGIENYKGSRQDVYAQCLLRRSRSEWEDPSELKSIFDKMWDTHRKLFEAKQKHELIKSILERIAPYNRKYHGVQYRPKTNQSVSDWLTSFSPEEHEILSILSAKYLKSHQVGQNNDIEYHWEIPRELLEIVGKKRLLRLGVNI